MRSLFSGFTARPRLDALFNNSEPRTPNPDSDLSDLARHLGRARTVLLIAFSTLSAFIVLYVPYYAWDALAYGEWSRLIAETGGFFFPSTSDQCHHRPLFYVVQGWIWRWLGFEPVWGRLFAASFTVLFLAALVRLAGRGKNPSLERSAAVILPLLCPHFLYDAFSGLTDVPVAALMSAAALLLWTGDIRSARRGFVLGLTALCAGLVKPSAYFALAGLGLAHCVGPRQTLRRRMIEGVVPLAVGTALSLPYHLYAARRLEMSVFDFLRAGTTGYYETLSARMRFEAVVGFGWLGTPLRMVLMFACAYAVVRVFGKSHRVAARGAAVVANALFWSAPGCVRFVTGTPGAWLPGFEDLAAYAVFAPATFLAARCPDVFAPSREYSTRLLVWAAPTVIAWSMVAAYDGRLTSPAWTPLFLLMVAVFPMMCVGLRQWGRLPATALVVVLVGWALADLRLLDGLGIRKTARIAGLVLTSANSPEAVRGVLNPSLEAAVSVAARETGPNDRMISNDNRFRFFFPGRVEVREPRKCRNMARYKLFLFRTDTTGFESLQTRPAGLEMWKQCESPRLIPIIENGDYVVFRIEADFAPPARPKI